MLTQIKANTVHRAAAFAASVSLAAISVLSLNASGPQSGTEQARLINPILVVTATHITTDGIHSYEYLRVFRDSTAQCESSIPGTPAKTKKLTDDEFDRIRSILSDPQIVDLKSNYGTLYAVVDSSTKWKIDFQYRGQLRSVDVLEFSPGLAKAMKHPYPRVLVRLGCTILKLRSEISTDSISLDSECTRSLSVQ